MTRQSFIAIVAAVCVISPAVALVGCSHSAPPPPPVAATPVAPPPGDASATAAYQKAMGMAADHATAAKAAAAAPKQ